MGVELPEERFNPEQYYDKEQAATYDSSSRMNFIQQKLSERALELIGFENSCQKLILELGLVDYIIFNYFNRCGTGISSRSLMEKNHKWVGVDISRPMLEVAKENIENKECGLCVYDMGLGIPFRTGIFDGIIR
ncbi:MAG: Williams Beuren syndrome chromosome region 22 protein [Paramarteilia canceri]